MLSKLTITFLITILTKKRLLIFLVFSQNGLAFKYGVILQYEYMSGFRIEFSNTWCKNCQSGNFIRRN